MLKKIFSGLLFLALMVSCTQEIEIFPQYVIPGTTNSLGQSAITFSGYSSNAKQMTRAVMNSASGTGYDDFSLYVWTKDSTVINNWHTQWVTGGWTYVNVEPNQYLKYFDNFVNQYNFIGIIPQTTASLSNGTVTLGVESFMATNENNTPKEFLYATTTVPKSEYPQGATMNFLHGNAKVYLKFISDDANTQIIDYSPVTQGSTETHFNIKKNSNVILSATNYNSTNYIPQALIDEIKSYYAVDGSENYDIKTMDSGTHTLKVVKTIPNEYKMSCDMGNTGEYFEFFNGFKYLQDNGYNVTLNKPDVANYILLDGYVNGTAYTVAGFNFGVSSGTVNSKPITTTIPPSGKEGIILLPATSVNNTGSDAILATYPETANVSVSLEELSWNITSTNNILQYNLPVTNITSNSVSTAIPAASVWYNLPCNNSNVGYTLKVSYIYKGVTVYDSRVFIPASECQWVPGKYYTYVINIKGRGNGHSEPNDLDAEDPVVGASDENSEISLFLIEFTPYEDGGTIIKQIQ